jgi:hypothetical protein
MSTEKWILYITERQKHKRQNGAAETERAKPYSSPCYSLADSTHKADNYSQADSSLKADNYSQAGSSHKADNYSQADYHCREQIRIVDFHMCKYV